ncbi:MAG: 30S ribosomal protein S17 [Verrucomicrobia bacterium]|nr:30S ribosomal protein S17 [Verrucomicrobiota bacterium]MCG2679006.1 30S ribosomal protein S17 [Kiritimatiellia bacterium]MBU4248358.1 30S ribosomal protein S17 [Verrucomicrobiota bacterium]MBU4289743.1 30S ribosomal protein S17 [Verrucomicrobiota bacterium]MBU4428543.1 30S ribosomal protein S17 [Verrucomicrobiota bacterium]
MEIKRHKRKERMGVVISDAMDKTIVVRVERRVRHPMYGKEMRLYSKFYAHDEKDVAKCGDRVRIVETRPLSRLKRWRLVEIVQAGTKIPASGGRPSRSKQA